jgi:hypothetical protein
VAAHLGDRRRHVELISRVAYCTRDQVKSALDIKETARVNEQVDRAIVAASENVEGFMHRRFWPEDGTRYFDWPNFQYAYPWRIWFDQYDLVVATQVTTGGQVIPLGDIFFEPVNKQASRPYEYMELDRSTNVSFGVGPTPQHDVAITGTWGFGATTDPAGTLTANIGSSDTALTVSDGSQVGVGNLLVIDSERILVQERANSSTGQTNLSGVTTAERNDQVITVTNGAAVNLGEVLQIDGERLLITDVTGNSVTVIRAWDGTTLAAHSAATTLYASRTLTVSRGLGGTTAASHTSTTAVGRHQVPAMIRNLTLAESINSVLQEQSGYARMVGSPDMAIAAPGFALAELWEEARTNYGRKSRTLVI